MSGGPPPPPPPPPAAATAAAIAPPPAPPASGPAGSRAGIISQSRGTTRPNSAAPGMSGGLSGPGGLGSSTILGGGSPTGGDPRITSTQLAGAGAPFAAIAGPSLFPSAIRSG